VIPDKSAELEKLTRRMATLVLTSAESFTKTITIGPKRLDLSTMRC